MPDNKSKIEKNKLGKLSNFFRTNFGIKQNKPSQTTTKPSLAKAREEAPKTSVKKTLKNAVQRIKHPITKQIIKATNEKEFEKAFNRVTTQKIQHLSSIKAAVYYIKFLQLYGTYTSKIIMKGMPKVAAADLEGIIESKDFQESTQDKLLLLSERIKKINPTVWKGIIKIIDNSFDSKTGSETLSQLADVKENISAQQEKTIIKKMITEPLSNPYPSPSTAPSNIVPPPPTNPLREPMAPTHSQTESPTRK